MLWPMSSSSSADVWWDLILNAEMTNCEVFVVSLVICLSISCITGKENDDNNQLPQPPNTSIQQNPQKQWSRIS